MGDPAQGSGQPSGSDDVPQPQIVNPTSKKSTDSSVNKPEGCWYFLTTGRCRYGEECALTHHKNVICWFWWTSTCPRDSCRYAHQQPEKPEENLNVDKESSVISIPTANSGSKTNPLFKTRLCTYWKAFHKCNQGGKCEFAHGEAELRPTSLSLGSESANTRVASSTWKKATPNNAGEQTSKKKATPNNAGEQTDQQEETQTDPKEVKKIDGIYGDWIEDKDCSTSEQEQ